MSRMLRFARRQEEHSGHAIPLSLGDKLQRLAILAPDALDAIEVLVDEALRKRWPAIPRTPLKRRP